MHLMTPDANRSGTLYRKLQSDGQRVIIDGSDFKSFTGAMGDLESIKNCSVLLVDNIRALTRDMTQKIIVAIMNQRPIVLTDLPNFGKNISPLEREIILKRTNKIIVASLDVLNPDELSIFLKSIISSDCNYTLTRRERTLSKSYINMRLRELVD